MTKIILDRRPFVCNPSLFPEHLAAFRIGVFNHIKATSRVLGSDYVSLWYLYSLMKAAEIRLARRVEKYYLKHFGLSCVVG